jgi:PAS domain S-box-containing protein
LSKQEQKFEEGHRIEDVPSRQELELRATLYCIGDGVISTGIEGRVNRMNPAAEQLTGWTEAEARGCPIEQVFYIINEQTRRQVENPVARVLRERTVVGLANHTLLISKDGTEIPIADSGAPIFDSQGNITGVVLVFRDQTGERLTRRLIETRLSLIEYAAAHTLDEFLTRALDEAGDFVESPIGFYHFVEFDQKTLMLQQWSTRTLKEFCQAAGKGMHYGIDQAGVWVDAAIQKKPVIHNDYASLPHKKGMPEGHARVIRELVTPVMREGRVAAILGVGNKPSEYTQKDVEIVSYLADVTWEIVRQKRGQESLRESERRYRELFENSRDGFVIVDAKGHFINANPAYCQMLGYTLDELRQKADFYEITPPQWRDWERQEIWEKRLLREGYSGIYEKEYIRKDGTVFPVELHSYAFFNKDGAPDYLWGIARDITERRQAEEALKASEENYRTIFNSVNDAIVIFHAGTGKPLDINSRVAELSGYGMEELTQMKIEDWITGDPMVMSGDIVQRIKEAALGKPQLFEWSVRRKDGRFIWVEINLKFAVIRGQKCVLAVIRDITGRKKTEEALEKRLIALTMPLDDTNPVNFQDLFNLNDIQRLQDEFAEATGVASIITHTDGTPITRPSHFCRLCSDIIRKTEKGRANCYQSDAVIGRVSPLGPIIQPCMSGGLWDAGAAISVGGKHIANWLIGQVRDDTQTEEKIREYARKIQTDEEAAVEAFREVPAMSRERFGQIAQVLFTLASQLSAAAYQNVQQARFITHRNAAEKALRESEEKYRRIFENSVVGFFQSTPEGRFINVNPVFARMLAYESPEDLVENIFNIAAQYYVNPEDRREYQKILHEKGYVENFEFRARRKDGLEIWVSNSTRVHFQDGRPALYEGVVVDITDRKRAEKERERLEQQFRQSQKMESVGRLAGGVAHDFNNMLSVILGHSEIGLNKMDPAHPVFANLEEIHKAALRSANLTRQLLAFARKQTISPRMLDLNETVEGMLKMLRRLIGEDIDLVWLPRTGLWPAKVDPSQIDQILANLCVNARDAISGVGKITIETGMTTFDEEYCAHHPGFVPGDFILLTVSDNGCGMDRATLDKIFEPFFTTKEVGMGTGLGLATIYGIVKQNNGFINVYSEPGQGTTFRIYLPRHADMTRPIPKESPPAPAVQGHETILLVEDEPAILHMGKQMLERFGYRVLAASTPAESIQTASDQAGKIHLLITDVVMPEMNGRDLAKNLISLYPELKCLFMSGYTANVIAHHGVLEEGVHFIQKPFSMMDLAATVRKVLDS